MAGDERPGEDEGRSEDEEGRYPRRRWYDDRRKHPPLDRRCEQLVEELRKRCPGVLPEDPLPPGEPGEPLPVEPERYAELAGLAARQTAAIAALGRVPASDDDLPEVVVWEQGGAALAVCLSRLELSADDGVVTVVVPVWCDQLHGRPRDVRVAFAVGSPSRPAGLLAATTERPEGPEAVVAVWAEQLTALAWQAVLDAAAGLAAHAGTDEDGVPLVATALAASPGRLDVVPQARHAFDRLLTGRVVVR